MRTKAMPRTCLGVVCVAVAAAGCTSERIGSQLEAEATFACAEAIEEQLGRELPRGWQYLLDEGDRDAFVEAWAPGKNSESTPPGYTCVVVRDQETRLGVRVVEVVDGARDS